MKRSKCPISNALDFVGDKWSLLILRDIILYDKSTFKELQESDEHIATNILTDRLVKLEKEGFINKNKHPKDKRRVIYVLNEKGIDMIPILIEMIVWSKKHYPSTYVPEDFLEGIINHKDKIIQDIIKQKKMDL